MKKLFIKLFRDIRRSFGQFIAVTIVSAIGVALLTGFSVTYASMKNMTDTYYSSGNLADLSAYYLGIDEAGIKKIKSIAGISDAYGRIVMKAASADGKSDFLIHSVSEDMKIDVPQINRGRLPQTAQECMVDDSYAKANGLSTGDSRSVAINGQVLSYRISGIFNTAEYVYLVENPAKDPLPDHKAFGLLYVDRQAIAALAGAQAYNEVLVTLKPGTDADKVQTAIESATKSYGFGHITMKKDQLSYSQLQSDIDTVSAISDSFPYIFFLVAAAIIFISMSRTVQSERGQIGIMKALGIRNAAITLHYLSYSIASGLAGSLLGSLVGVLWIPQFMLGMYSSLYTFPSTVISGFWPYVLLSAAVILLLGMLSGSISTRKVLRESAAQCMRPILPKKVRQTLLEKNEKLWNRVSYKNKLILRNILFNKQRAVLSSIGIIGCVGVLLCGFGLKEAASSLYNDQFSKMQSFDYMVLLTQPVPDGSPLPFDGAGLARSEKFSIVPATIRLSRDVSSELNMLPAGNESITLSDIGGSPLALPTDGILFPYKLAQQYGIKPGDTVEVKLESALYKNMTVRVRVAAIDVMYLSQDLYASTEYMQKLGLSPYVNGYYIHKSADHPQAFSVDQVSKAQNVKSVVSQANLRNSMQSMMGMMDTFFLVMIVMSAALALAVIFNISSINIFERRRDIATLKVLGYHKREINSLIYAENLIITAFGSVLGLAFGAVVYKYLLQIIVSQDMFFPYKITFAMAGLAVLLAFVFTLFANLTLRGKTRRIDMVESLKSVE